MPWNDLSKANQDMFEGQDFSIFNLETCHKITNRLIGYTWIEGEDNYEALTISVQCKGDLYDGTLYCHSCSDERDENTELLFTFSGGIT